jgi:hypothetical protein
VVGRQPSHAKRAQDLKHLSIVIALFLSVVDAAEHTSRVPQHVHAIIDLDS